MLDVGNLMVGTLEVVIGIRFICVTEATIPFSHTDRSNFIVSFTTIRPGTVEEGELGLKAEDVQVEARDLVMHHLFLNFWSTLEVVAMGA